MIKDFWRFLRGSFYATTIITTLILSYKMSKSIYSQMDVLEYRLWFYPGALLVTALLALRRLWEMRRAK